MQLLDRVTRHARLSMMATGDLPSPPFLILFINSLCNMRCEHCFYLTHLNKRSTFRSMKRCEKFSMLSKGSAPNGW